MSPPTLSSIRRRLPTIASAITAILALLILSSASAQAQISSWGNGGFETGLTSWTPSLNSGSGTFSVNSTGAHTGTYCFEASVTNPGTTSPSLTHTTFVASASSTYELSFWAIASPNRALMHAHIVSESNSYYVDFQPSSVGYDQYHYCFKASGVTTVSFTFDGAANYFLDDIEIFDENDPVIDTTMAYLWQWGLYAAAQPEVHVLTGTDNDISVPLPDGRVVWVYNDTWIGPLNFYSNYRGDHLTLPRNYGVVQTGSVLKPASNMTLAVPKTPGDIYWSSDGAVDGNKLEVIMQEVAGGGADGQVGQAINVVSLPDLKPLGVVNLPLNYSFILNAGDGYFYIYSGNFPVTIARTPLGHLADIPAWTYYNGSTWVSDSAQAAPFTHFSKVSSVERLGPNNFVSISYGFLGYEVYAQFAPSPIGPWSTQVQIGTVPGQAADDYFYTFYIHKETAQNGIYSIGYSDNGSGEPDSLVNDKCFYLPHYIKSPNLLALSPYTTYSFTESFDHSYDAVEWQNYGGTWAVTNGRYTESNSTSGSYAIAKGVLENNLTYRAQVTCTSSGGSSGLIFRASTYSSGGADSYLGYNATLVPGTGVVLSKSSAGGINTVLATYPMAIISGTTYPMKVIASGASIQVYVTDLATPVISTTDSTYTSGGIGVRSANAISSFDNISVVP